jgi:hypothetical protein
MLQIFWRWVISKDPFVDKVPKSNQIFPVGLTSGKGLRDSGLKGNTRKEAAALPAGILQPVTTNLERGVQLHVDAGGRRFQRVMCRDAVSRST